MTRFPTDDSSSITTLGVDEHPQIDPPGLQRFSDWLDEQLRQLELRHQDSITRGSQLNSLIR